MTKIEKCTVSNFYPRPPRGGRRAAAASRARPADFYPRPPRGGRRRPSPVTSAALTFLSTPSARRATSPLPVVGQGRRISIHALREEGDAFPSPLPQRRKEFLSTPSARRATRLCRCITSPAGYFYPRPPRGGRPVTLTGIPGVVKFLSTPSARRATSEIYGEERAYQFLSTPSARRATADVPWCIPSTSHFYPRPPRGGRRADSGSGKIGKRISIHALREEGDRPYRHHLQQCCKISIHALREEGDLIQHGQNLAQLVISIHTLREEGDTKSGDTWDLIALFLSTPSARRATVKQSTK